MYATDGQTDGRTKSVLIAPFPTLGGIVMEFVIKSIIHNETASNG